MKNRKYYKNVFKNVGLCAVFIFFAYVYATIHTNNPLPFVTTEGISKESQEVQNNIEFYLQESHKQLVVLKFYAEYCPPCTSLAPLFEEIAKEYHNQHLYVSINIADNEALVNFFKVKSIPNIVILKDGVIVDQIIGFLNKSELVKKILYHVEVKKKVAEAKPKLNL